MTCDFAISVTVIDLFAFYMLTRNRRLQAAWSAAADIQRDSLAIDNAAVTEISFNKTVGRLYSSLFTNTGKKTEDLHITHITRNLTKHSDTSAC